MPRFVRSFIFVLYWRKCECLVWSGLLVVRKSDTKKGVLDWAGSSSVIVVSLDRRLLELSSNLVVSSKLSILRDSFFRNAFF